MEEETKKTEVVEKKKSKLPLIIVVVLLVIGGVVGGIFIGKNLNSKDTKNETKTEEKKDNKVAYGNDKNTTGLKVLETKTKNITLNGTEYELKIEILEGKINIDNIPEGAGVADYRENVYVNGYKFIDNQDVNDSHVGFGEESMKEMIFDSIYNQLDNARTLRDTNNKDEYLVFKDISGNGIDTFLYVINTKGEILAKIMEGCYSLGFYISSNSIIDKEHNYSECREDFTCEAKYNIYGLSIGLTYVKDDYILFIPIQNAEKASNQLLNSNFDSSKVEVEENKLTISNGKINISKATTFKGTDGYIFSIGGQGVAYYPDDIVKPAE